MDFLKSCINKKMMFHKLTYKVMDKEKELMKIECLINDLCHFAQVLRQQKKAYITCDSDKDINEYQISETKQVIADILSRI